MEREQPNGATEAQTNRPGWRFWLIVALLASLALPGVITWVSVLIQRPTQDNVPQFLTLAFLVVALMRHGKPAIPTLRPNAFGLGVIIFTGMLYLLGLWLSVKALVFISLLTLAASLYWTWFGAAKLYRALPVFLFALFLLPQCPTDLRTTISLPLQLISTQLATGLASLFIPIQTTGNIFYVKGEAFEVTAACSGLNTWTGYLFAGMLAMMMGRFSFGRFGRLLVGAPILALAGNAIRLWITAMMAYWVSVNAGLAIHTNLEYIIFPAGLLIMVLAERQIERRFPLSSTTGETTNDALNAQSINNQSEKTSPIAIDTPFLAGKPRNRLAIGTAVCLLLLNLGAWLGLNSPQADANAAMPTSLTASLPPAPYQLGVWHGRDLPLRNHETEILAPATLVSREYSIGDRQPGQPIIWLNLIEAKSMNALHNMVDSLIASGAKPTLKGTLVLQTGKGPLKASWYRCVETNGNHYNLLLWYEWAGGSAENRWAWYWNVLQMKLRRQQPVWRLVELATPGTPNESGPELARTLEQLKGFATDFYPATVP